MGQKNFIPERNKAYLADDYNNLGEKFTIDETVYRFVAIPAQQLLRKGTLVKLDNLFNATMMNSVVDKFGGIIDFDINTIDGNAALYCLIVDSGDAVAEVAAKAKACVYVQASIVGYDNGVTRAVNSAFAAGTGYTKMNATSQVQELLATGSQNYVSHVAEGDVAKTNLAHYGVIGSVVNGSSLILSAWAGSTADAASYSVTVTKALGALANFGKKAAYTCGAYLGRVINASGLNSISGSIPSVNVCGASTILFVNSCVSGSLVKVGDLIKLAGTATATGTSSFLVASINNAYAFTVNAAPAADAAGMMGVFANVNYYYATVRIDGNS